jgi:hypothetical protein
MVGHSPRVDKDRKCVDISVGQISYTGAGIATSVEQLTTGWRRPGFKPGSGHVEFCNGQKWRWGSFSARTSVSPANLHSICFSTNIFTITRGWHNRPGVAAVPIASQTRIKKKYGLDDWGVGVRVPIWSRIFCSPRCPDLLWGPPNLLSNGYRGLSPGVERQEGEASH